MAMVRLIFINVLFISMIMGSHLVAKEVKQEASIYESGELYLASEQQMADIDKTIAKAKEENKLALIILGANWCHDSRALASRLFLPEVKSVIDRDYELLFVDVGYLTNVKASITRFGMPVIYATPTVLIVDPETEERINGHNMHIWRDADKVSVSDTISYFLKIAKDRANLLSNIINDNNNQSNRLKELNQSINEFEKQQADRIYKAFSILGPLLKKRKEGGKAKDFMKHWVRVAKLRYSITDDLSKLRQQAKDIAFGKSEASELFFPEYQAFDWE